MIRAAWHAFRWHKVTHEPFGYNGLGWSHRYTCECGRQWEVR